jgi:predicted dehydrogenase
MKIGVIGCGYVLDLYLATFGRYPWLTIAGIADRNGARARAAGAYYGLPVRDVADLLADPEIEIIANFTSIESHFDVSRAALDAGKHVYSEKPFTTSIEDARTLVAMAEKRKLKLGSAPSNALSATAQTLWKIVEDGALGNVRIVYAEFDDNPVYLLRPETWRSPSGAPWPYLHEYKMGCTWEHVGYHLSWMCAIFGPVRSVTAFSKRTLPDKTNEHIDPPDTPDFSVACLDFHSGVVGRITCSIAAPADHRMRIIGNRGMAEVDTYRDYKAPIYLEAFNEWTLKAHNLYSVRRHSLFRWPFGVGGRRVPLAETPAPGNDSVYAEAGLGPKAILRRFKRRQLGEQDKCLGLAELADAVAMGRPPFASHDFILHQTELTLAIQAAGVDGKSILLKTRFDPLKLPERTRKVAPNYVTWARPAPIPRLMSGFFSRLLA